MRVVGRNPGGWALRVKNRIGAFRLTGRGECAYIDGVPPMLMPDSPQSSIAWSPKTTGRSVSAFTLVEVTLALGIFSFAIMALFGLLPVAMQTHQDSKASTVLAQIQQRLVAELLLTDGAVLDTVSTGQRNFDGEGRELESAESNLTVYSSKLEVLPVSLPGGSTSQSLRRAALWAVENPSGKAIAAAVPTSGILLSEAENASTQ